jgi:hypothetical protein
MSVRVSEVSALTFAPAGEIAVELAPVQPGGDYARADLVADLGAQPDASAAVEDLYLIAMEDAARRCVCRVHFKDACSLRLHALMSGVVSEGGVHVVVCLARQKFERIGLSIRTGFARSDEDGNGNKFALSAGCAKPACIAEGQRLAVCVERQSQWQMAFALQALAVDAGEPWAGALERLVDEVVDGVVEAGFGKAHAAGEFTEERDVVADLAGRRDGLLRDLDEEMAVGSLHVLGLKEGRRGKEDVGVVGGVGEELLVDDGEEIVARRPRRTAFWLGATAAAFEL